MQDLRPNSQDTSAFYLEKIYEIFADPNVTSVSVIATRGLARPPAFSPPKYAVWVNSLWFLSLVIGLNSALLATLLQQWARRYVRITQTPRYSLHKRARVRAFFAEGVDKLYVHWAVEGLPALLHLSLALFFSGLLIFLFNMDHTVFSVVAWWAALSTVVYGCITVMPIFRHDSPYYAPLSSSAWFLYTGVAYAVFRSLWLIGDVCRHTPWFRNLFWTRFFLWMGTFRRRLLQGIRKTAEETAWRLSSEIDGRVLMWTFNSLDEDHEFEQFFEGVLGFFRSKEVKLSPSSFAKLGAGELSSALTRFLYRTRSSDILPESIQKRRLVVCTKAADATHLSDAASCILNDIFMGRWRGVLQSVEMGHSLRTWIHSGEQETGLCAQIIVSAIIASVRVRDNSWIALAKNQFGVSEDVLRDYLAHGDSALLANLVHISRQILRSTIRGDLYLLSSTWVLRPISRFNVKHTLPQLQDDFCALWNEVVLEARKSGAYSTPIFILRSTRHIYIALHQDTDAAPTAFTTSTIDRNFVLYEPSSYPLCNIAHHRTNAESASHRPDVDFSFEKDEDGAYMLVLTPSTVLYHDTAVKTTTPHTGPDPELSLPSPHTTVELFSPNDRLYSPLCLTSVPALSQSISPGRYHVPSSSPNTVDADTPPDVPCPSTNSSTASPTTQPILDDSATSQHNEGSTIVAPITAFDVSTSPSATIPTLSGVRHVSRARS